MNIKIDKEKKLIFVAFSEDETKIMSLSNDGVVIVRGIDYKYDFDKTMTWEVMVKMLP